MSLDTPQTAVWAAGFGREYTDRNAMSPEELDATYVKMFGISRTDLNREFLAKIDPAARILEVGCNVGSQLLALQRLGFSRLFGIELQPYAVEVAKTRARGVNILQGSTFDLPFKDGYFGVVFTSGVLIHIAPADLPAALAEIHRCTSTWIWGFEYFAPKFVEVRYRGHEQLLWKGDYEARYRQLHPDLELVQARRLKHLADENIDTMFLLRRTVR